MKQYSVQVTRHSWLGTLLEISDDFNFKLNVFSYMIFEWSVFSVQSFKTKLNDFGKHSGVVVLLGSFVCTTRVYLLKGEG